MALKPQQVPLAKLPEPKRSAGACWTALAVVLAAGSGALNTTGWVTGVDTDSVIAIALGGTLVGVCIASEGTQLLALVKAEKAFKARPYKLVARGSVLIGIGVLCAAWNAYSATRAIDALNRHNEELVWSAYRGSPNELDRLNAVLSNHHAALADLGPEDAPLARTLAEQETALALIPVTHSTNKNKAIEAMLSTQAEIDLWLKAERLRVDALIARDGADIAAEISRVEALASAKNIPLGFELGLSIGIELLKLVMLWAGTVEIKKRKKAGVADYAAAFTRLRERVSNVLTFKRKAA